MPASICKEGISSHGAELNGLRYMTFPEHMDLVKHAMSLHTMRNVVM